MCRTFWWFLGLFILSELSVFVAASQRPQGTTTPSADSGTVYANTYPSLAAAIATANTSKNTLVLPCGNYVLTTTQVISANNFTMRGENGDCVNVNIAGTGDVFQIQGQLTRFENLQFTVTASSREPDSAIFNVNSITGAQPTFRGLRFVGAAIPDNGSIFFSKTPSAGDWFIQDIRVPGTLTWTSIVKLVSSSTTIASIQIDDIKSSATWSDAAFAFDGAIDTVHLNGLDLVNGLGNGKPILHLRNTVGSGIAPRWIHCVNCTIESRNGTAIRLDASRDFRYLDGLIASANVG